MALTSISAILRWSPGDVICHLYDPRPGVHMTFNIRDGEIPSPRTSAWLFTVATMVIAVFDAKMVAVAVAAYRLASVYGARATYTRKLI
jgi:hypothetical protein